MTSDPLTPEASLTSAVQPGDDPLSQSLPHGERLSEGLSNSMDHAHHNEEGGAGRVGARPGAWSYGRCLSEDDHRNLRNFVIDLVSKKLLPHLNEVLKNLNEWVSGSHLQCMR